MIFDVTDPKLAVQIKAHKYSIEREICYKRERFPDRFGEYEERLSRLFYMDRNWIFQDINEETKLALHDALTHEIESSKAQLVYNEYVISYAERAESLTDTSGYYMVIDDSGQPCIIDYEVGRNDGKKDVAVYVKRVDDIPDESHPFKFNMIEDVAEDEDEKISFTPEEVLDFISAY